MPEKIIGLPVTNPTVLKQVITFDVTAIEAVLTSGRFTVVKAEVIFLTHNEKRHLYNLENNIPGEELMWTPEIQEVKTSQYGGKNVRYRYDLKAEYIKDFINLHDKIIPWNTIRYIF